MNTTQHQLSKTGPTSPRLAHPIFNNTYEIIRSLGEGNTSKVYLGRCIAQPNQFVAIKVLREEFLQKDKDALLSVQNEITILKSLKHAGIVGLFDFGDSGTVQKTSGRVLNNLVYIVMEYVQGGLLFDLCQLLSNMGEDAGRFFLMQLLDSVEYMHNKQVVHRDLKLENILIDSDLNMKIADFGFASYKNVHDLSSYRGTMTYMAPEIKEGKHYDGTQVDVFSIGVILFILVQGIFPFKEARTEEFFYGLILKGDFDTYWKKTHGENLSPEFKDLILSMFSYDPAKRPTIKEIRSHPWLSANKNFDFELTRNKLLQTAHIKQNQMKPVQKPVKVTSHKRGNSRVF